jgi:N-acetylmuramoyl-L-alanine amidase
MTHQIRNDRLYIDGEEACFETAHSFGGSLAPQLIVLHDTAGRLEKGSSVAWFASEDCTTSAHVVVERDGTITQCVPFNRVAYHAGASEWQGRKSCNGFSIGIEIVNPGKLDTEGRAWFHKTSRDPRKWQKPFPVPDLKRVKTNEHGDGRWMDYTPAQIAAVTELCKALRAAYPKIADITTHWFIAPGRKVDTNPLFPVDRLRAAVFAPAVGDSNGESPTVHHPDPQPTVVATNSPLALAKTIYESRSIWAAVMAFLWTVFGYVTDGIRWGWEWIVWAAGIAPAVYKEAKETLTPLQEMANWVGVNVKGISIAVAALCIVVVLVRHVLLRLEANPK